MKAQRSAARPKPTTIIAGVCLVGILWSFHEPTMRWLAETRAVDRIMSVTAPARWAELKEQERRIAGQRAFLEDCQRRVDELGRGLDEMNRRVDAMDRRPETKP